MHLRRNFQAERVESDEAGGVVLIAGFGPVGFHRGNVHIKKLITSTFQVHCLAHLFA
jgi:hypothetical protein